MWIFGVIASLLLGYTLLVAGLANECARELCNWIRDLITKNRSQNNGGG